MSDRPHPLLGSLTAADFLRSHWQREPLLVRGALTGYSSPLSADELAGLSLEEEVESRIVTGSGSRSDWALEHGPFDETRFDALGNRDWTLLVQAVDLWVPEAANLTDRFDFLPRWRIDDIMVSFAAPGGSVGPHYDLYDVFLVQVEGTRRWHLGDACGPDSPLLAGVDLKILANFESRQEWLLEPGDLLYVPPGLGHWGVAESPSLTYSVGFRSPLLADMLGDLAIEMMAQGKGGAYRDPVMTPELASDELRAEFVESARAQLHAAIDDDELLADWLARYMSAPKLPDQVDLTGESRRVVAQGFEYINGERVS